MAKLLGGFKHGWIIVHNIIIYIYIYIWVVILPIDFHIFQDGNIAPPSSKKWEGTGRGVMKREFTGV